MRLNDNNILFYFLDHYKIEWGLYCLSVISPADDILREVHEPY